MLKPFFIKKKNIDNRLLPVVSAADAGKVLGVTEDGKVAAVEAGGGDGILVIGFNESDSLDKSYTEILKAYQNNIPIILNDYGASSVMFIPYLIIPSDNKIHMEFAALGYNATNTAAQLQVMILDYNSDNTVSGVSFNGYSIQVTPLS